MSGLDGLRLDADGYLDMDAHGSGPELGDDAVLDLREALLADPVEEPTAEEWSDLVDSTFDADDADAGPFAVDDLPPFDPDDVAVDLTDPDPSDGLGDDGEPDADADADTDADADGPGVDGDPGLDADAHVTDSFDDWTLDDAGDADLDVLGLDDGSDDLFPDDGGGDALPEVVPDIEDLL